MGTDVFHAAILLWAAGIAHWVGGNVDFALMGTILLGLGPGRVDRRRARLRTSRSRCCARCWACVLLGSALGVMTKAGAELPAWAIVGAPLARRGGSPGRSIAAQTRANLEPAWARTS